MIRNSFACVLCWKTCDPALSRNAKRRWCGSLIALTLCLLSQAARGLEPEQVHLLENPTRDDIIDKFDELREKLFEDDNLLIYYAGHGWLDELTATGYWLPVDARVDRRSHWVSNGDLTAALKGLFAKHVMVVADSCYSGTLTRGIKVPERNRA